KRVTVAAAGAEHRRGARGLSLGVDTFPGSSTLRFRRLRGLEYYAREDDGDDDRTGRQSEPGRSKDLPYTRESPRAMDAAHPASSAGDYAPSSVSMAAANDITSSVR